MICFLHFFLQFTIERLPPNRLGAGERAAITYAHAYAGCVVGLDDLRARNLAEAPGLKVVGTLGILLRAKRAGLIAVVQPLPDQVIAQGFLLASELYHDVLEIAGEAQ